MINSISIIGAGNVARAIAIALYSKGIEIKEILSLSESAQNLASLCNAKVCNEISAIQKVDLVLLCVSDMAIEEVDAALAPSQARAHTSGSIHLIDHSNTLTGVLYPLQTFSKSKKVDWDNIPIGIEASNIEFEIDLVNLAQLLSCNVQKISSEQRRILHLAAVFACNFSNHMYSLSESILKQHNLNFNLLKPLIEETAQKALITDPVLAQTGPAQREDLNTIAGHILILENHPDLKNIYKLLSQSIIDLKHGKEL